MAQNPTELLEALEADLQHPESETGAPPPTPEKDARQKPVGGDAQSDAMPPIILAAAGLAVFDAIICLVYVVVWIVSPLTLLAIIQAMAGISLLLGVSPVVVAGVIFSKNRQTGIELPGTPFAVWAMISGSAMMMLTLAVPLVAAIQTLTGRAGS